MGGDHLTFHPGMDSLLSDLNAEMPQPATEKVLAFVYHSISEEARELEANSGCRPASAGKVEQQLYTTDRADVGEVRLKVTDKWRSVESEETLALRLIGSCRYGLADGKLYDLLGNEHGAVHGAAGRIRTGGEGILCELVGQRLCGCAANQDRARRY